MDIPFIYFRFKGGNICRLEESESSCDAFNDVFEKLVGDGFSAIFPSGCSTPSNVDLAMVDVPLEGDMRVHCTYFKAVEARAFWNVFCFAYSVSACTEDMWQAMLDAGAEEWHQALCDLTPASRSIRLDVPRRQSGRSHWSGQGCYIESFPMPNGSPFTCKGEDIDWERKLQLPRPREEKLSLQPRESPLRSQKRGPGLVLPCILLFLLGVGLGWLVKHAAQSWKDAKLDEQDRLIRQLQTKIGEQERLLQQKAATPSSSPTSAAGTQFPADGALRQTEQADPPLPE